MATFKTEREFLEAIVNGNFGDNFTEFATKRIKAINDKNEKRKTSAAVQKKNAENDGIKAAILAALANGETLTGKALAEICGVSTQKISALCTQLADIGEIEVSEVKETGKAKVKGYALAEVEPEFEGEDGEDVPVEG